MIEPVIQSVARRRADAVVPEAVDVAVVGSGPGGLVAAALLAKRGLSVAVFESHYTAGGCATQFVRGPKRARSAIPPEMIAGMAAANVSRKKKRTSS